MKFQPPKGMRDFLPEEMIRRQFVTNTIKKVFEKWGFDPLDIPCVENFDVLSAKSEAGEAIKREIYYFKDQGDRELGLRFDLTVGSARVVASTNMPKPFKRYVIGKVWRYDNPQAGRFRELIQADVDIYGSDKPEADAEIIAVTCEVFKTLGFKDFKIRLNNRKILEGLMNFLEVKNYNEIFRIIDKMDKIGEDGVIKEMKEKKIKEGIIDNIIAFIRTKGTLEEIFKKFKINDGVYLQGVEELGKIIEFIKNIGYDKNIIIDLSLVRGLDYYTGPVFEVAVSGGKWSLAGGGRYDNMIKQLGGQDTPATGIGIGFERIVEVMKEERMFKLPNSNTKIFIAPVNDKVREQAYDLCLKLRNKGISADADLMGRKLSKQLDYISSRKITFVALVGEEELKKESVKLKNMINGDEKVIKIKDIENYL